MTSCTKSVLSTTSRIGPGLPSTWISTSIDWDSWPSEKLVSLCRRHQIQVSSLVPCDNSANNHQPPSDSIEIRHRTSLGFQVYLRSEVEQICQKPAMPQFPPCRFPALLEQVNALTPKGLESFTLRSVIFSKTGLNWWEGLRRRRLWAAGGCVVGCRGRVNVVPLRFCEGEAVVDVRAIRHNF